MASVLARKRLIAIISGAGSGIGKETAVYFAEKGYSLSLNSLSIRNEKALETTVNECIAKGLDKDSILTVPGDITDEKIATSLIDRTMEKFGRIDTLINAAGILVPGNVADCTMADFDRQMNVNLRSIVQLTQKAIPHLVRTKGSIINVSSINGICPFAGVTYYCMSKAALDQFTKCLAVELGPEGVRVNSVNPGVIITNIHKRAGMTDKEYADFIDRTTKFSALRKTGTALDVAKAIYFLASDDSQFITGDLLRIDGGRGIMHLR